MAEGQKSREPARLEWPGRTWTAKRAALGPPRAPDELAPKGVIHEVHGASELTKSALFFGTAEDVARTLLARGVRANLVYLDPPFASDRNYEHEFRVDGLADGRVIRTSAYTDKWSDSIGPYLDFLAPKLELAATLLDDTGSLWVHLDWRAAYLARVLLDEIMGRDAFRNEIVWRRAPNLGRQATSAQFGRTLDTLIVYAKKKAVLTPPTRLEPIDEGAIRYDDQGRPFTTAPRGDYTDSSIARLDGEGRVHRTSTGRVYIKYFLVKDEHGTLCRERRVDALWDDVPPLRHVAVSERTGYPTQKPLALLDRVIRSSTEEGGVVVDLFSGSGTTAVAAAASGRTFYVGDIGAPSLVQMRARLLRAGACFRTELLGRAFEKGRSAPSHVATPDADDARDVTLSLRWREPPVAWSVVERATDVPTIVAHAERSLGAKAAQLASSGQFRAPREGFVRIYGDDGSLDEHPLATSRAQPQRGAAAR